MSDGFTFRDEVDVPTWQRARPALVGQLDELFANLGTQPAIASTTTGLGNGSSATLGAVGGNGPQGTAQVGWLPVTLPNGQTSWLPLFR